MRKVKIVSTIGPSSEDPKVLKRLINQGIDVARLNFSHGDHEEQLRKLKAVRRISDKVAVMVDTKGPEIRMGTIEKMVVSTGDSLTLTEGSSSSDGRTIPVNYSGFIERLAKDDTIYVGDGQVELKVTRAGKKPEVKVIHGGTISSKKSLAVPGKYFGMQTPTRADTKDIKFAVDNGADILAVSFVRTADDVRRARSTIKRLGGDLHIMAKIENREGIDNIDEILEEADSIMVARGDMGVDIPLHEIPVVQKSIIKKCNERGKPVIVATQMLLSMVDNRRATRAEISDIANAVLDGADAVMLSEETAQGKYPVEAVEEMVRIIDQVESTYHKYPRALKSEQKRDDATDLICRSVWQVSKEMPNAKIIAHTSSGHTARHIAKYRPMSQILAFTTDEKVMRQLNLVWGVRAYLYKPQKHVHEMIRASGKLLFENKLCKKGDSLIITSGVPLNTSRTTNMMEIRTLSDVLGL